MVGAQEIPVVVTLGCSSYHPPFQAGGAFLSLSDWEIGSWGAIHGANDPVTNSTNITAVGRMGHRRSAWSTLPANAATPVAFAHVRAASGATAIVA